ncbi:Flp family type IVb pilin [Pelagibacterium xiamenense]|uniref:Flp family type IVb pilin n=1 Tax=Pelagibacterium xiamenense TaxID=2901140 RepID=UPI001E3A68F9|nr:Flp family type IVb pilin [Pelagibacterium xiamenense]MCD7058868.1 Flp family type IVb pilin [Pelagibacterium xiamenense]
MKKSAASFIRCSSGATAIEYGLICALLAVVIIVAVGFLNGPTQGLFSSAVSGFSDIEF